MRKIARSILYVFDDSLFRWMVKWLWPEYKRPRKSKPGNNWKVLKRYGFTQKILRINGKTKWPVDFRSKIVDAHNIRKGICCDPGDNQGIYINAAGGLDIGNNVNIGQNSIITTTNHYKYDHRKLSHTKGVTIGNNVWIGANVSIVAGSKIGNNVTIGAGCFISGEIPDNCTVIMQRSAIEIIPKTKPYEWDCTKDELL